MSVGHKLANGSSARVVGAFLVTIPCLLLGVAGSASAGGGATASTTMTFSSAGERIFEVPDGVTSLDVVAIGGRGGHSGGAGGFGGTATAEMPVTPGQVLYIEVGGNGGNGGGQGSGSGGAAGFNGGGAGGPQPGLGGFDSNGGGGGGGASDLRTLPRSAGAPSLQSRLIVAGGGGGGGGAGHHVGITGGGGGPAGLGGGPGTGSGPGGGGSGATPTAGGAGATNGGYPWDGGGGGVGAGGGGGSTDYGGCGGAGGGGLLGGGGGAAAKTAPASGGGGGGGGSSGFAATATNRSVYLDPTGIPLVRLTYNASGGSKSNSGLKFGKVKLNKQRGTATLPVTVPGTGDLTVGGKGVVKKRPGFSGRSFARKIAEAGTYKLRVKAKGRKKAKLFDTGKVRVKAVVTFKPSSGDAVKASKRIRLKKN